MRYYISRGGQQFGPYALADLQRYVQQGNILLNDLACGEGQTQWVPVSQILGSAAAPQPVQQPPQPASQLPPTVAQGYSMPQQPPPGQGYAQPYGAAAPMVAGPVMDYAQWGTRVLGYLIDYLLVGIAVGALWFVLGGLLGGLAAVSRNDSFGGSMCCLWLVLALAGSLLVGVYNRVYLVSQRGYSIGQGVVKVKVVDARGALLSRNTAFVRLLAQLGLGFVPLLGLLDLLWPLWDPQRQTLHDKAVSCYVINNPSGV